MTARVIEALICDSQNKTAESIDASKLAKVVLVLHNPPECSLAESILRTLGIKPTFKKDPFILQCIITTKSIFLFLFYKGVYMGVLCCMMYISSILDQLSEV